MPNYITQAHSLSLNQTVIQFRMGAGPETDLITAQVVANQFALSLNSTQSQGVSDWQGVVHTVEPVTPTVHLDPPSG